jgi:hypothetical protein
MKRNCFRLLQTRPGVYATVKSFSPRDAGRVRQHLQKLGYKRVKVEPECMGCKLSSVTVYGGPKNKGDKTICVKGVTARKSTIGP